MSESLSTQQFKRKPLPTLRVAICIAGKPQNLNVFPKARAATLVNVGIATTLKGKLIVGARSFPGNPYDGYTLNEQVEQLSILMQASGMTPQTAIVDLGYLNVGKENQNLDLKYRDHFNIIMVQERKLLKRGKVIVPIKGHLKQTT